MKTTIILIICILLPLALIPVYLAYNKYVKEQDDKILREGIITTGTVDFKDYNTDQGDIEYRVGYIFTVNGTVYESEARYWNTKAMYNKAVIGKRYVVRYIPDKPYKSGDNSRIYLDDPADIEK